MDAHGPWRIASLSPSHADRFLRFFDHERGRAFADNPDWAGCYCNFFHAHSRQAWDALDASANRTAIGARIEVGEMDGFIAQDADNGIVGWLNAQPRHKLPHCFTHLGVAPPPIDCEPHEAAVALCFVIDPALRRRGVARALLEHALATLTSRGLRVIDAFPTLDANSDAGHYRGPLKLYESAGFARIATSGNTVTMRRPLP